MRRSPAPDPALTAPHGIPPEDTTLEERTRYLLQEIGKEAGFLEQWIVHYLTELLEQANDMKALPRARSEARSEIARILPGLWEQRIAREALHIRRNVDYWLHRTDTLDLKSEQLLAAILADPDRTAEVTEIEAPHAFRALHALAELVTRLSLTTAVVEWTKREVASEAAWKFLKKDEELIELQAKLARSVPDFATLDLTDPSAVERLVHQTLIALTQAQLILLTDLAIEPPTPLKPKQKRSGPKAKAPDGRRTS